MKRLLFLFFIIFFVCKRENDDIVIVIEDNTITQEERELKSEPGITGKNHEKKRVNIKEFIKRFERYIKKNSKSLFIKDIKKLEDALEKKIDTEKREERKRKYRRILYYTRKLKREVNRPGLLYANKKLRETYEILKKEVDKL